MYGMAPSNIDFKIEGRHWTQLGHLKTMCGLQQFPSSLCLLVLASLVTQPSTTTATTTATTAAAVGNIHNLYAGILTKSVSLFFGMGVHCIKCKFLLSTLS